MAWRGHHGAYLIREGDARLHFNRGSPLGSGHLQDPELANFDFLPKDRLFLFTDGLLESSNKDFKPLSFKDLQKCLSSSKTSEDLKQQLLQEFNQRQGQKTLDDCSFLFIEYEEESKGQHSLTETTPKSA